MVKLGEVEVPGPPAPPAHTSSQTPTAVRGLIPGKKKPGCCKRCCQMCCQLCCRTLIVWTHGHAHRCTRTHIYKHACTHWHTHTHTHECMFVNNLCECDYNCESRLMARALAWVLNDNDFCFTFIHAFIKLSSQTERYTLLSLTQHPREVKCIETFSGRYSRHFANIISPKLSLFYRL